MRTPEHIKQAYAMGLANAWRGSKPDEGSLPRTEPSTDYDLTINTILT